MNLCGNCYVTEGVEQSFEQALLWLEKYLEVDDDEHFREVVPMLRVRRGGSVGTAGS